MKNGYQKFFNAAKQARKSESVKPGAKTQQKVPPFSKNATSVENALEQELKLRRHLKVRPRSAPFPMRSVAGLAVTLVGLGLYLAAPELIEGWVDRVEISAFGQADAAESKTPEKKPDEKKTVSAIPAPAPGDLGASADEVSHFEKLRARKEELDQREKELAQLDEELQRQKVELDKRIVQLEEMRQQIAQILKDRVEVDQEKVAKLVDLYSSMKPKQAADVIGSINEDLAVEILAKMKKKSAAEILNLLPAEKARILSEKYTGYRRSRALAGEG